WSALGGIKFGSQNPPDNVTWGTSGIPLNKSITPGSTYTFLLGVTAPITPGAYNFQWQMFRTGAGYFGVPTTNVAIQVGGGGGGGTNGAAFVSQSVPSSMTAGQVTGVSVTMNNNGSTTWTPGTYFLGSLNPQGNTTWGLNQVALGSSVAPGQNATFTFNITAP